MTSPRSSGLADPALERRDHTGAGAPGQVESRHRVAVASRAPVAALGPPDDREDPQALVVQPLPLLPRGEADVRLGPAPRPVVAVPVELGAAHPVLEGEVVGVLDAHPTLLGGVHQEQPAERPERLATEALLAAPGPAAAPDLPASASSAVATSPASPGSDDDDVCIHVGDPDTRGRSARLGHRVTTKAPLTDQVPVTRPRPPTRCCASRPPGLDEGARCCGRSVPRSALVVLLAALVAATIFDWYAPV